MAVLHTDPEWTREIIDDRRRKGIDKYDEVWDGVYVIPPPHDNEHRRIVAGLAAALAVSLDRGEGGHVYPGVNVSDRQADWHQNYRVPAVAVVLPDSTAEDREAYFVGGPDLVVEIFCRGADPRQKIPFYAKIGTRELLVIDRDPWGLELYQLQGNTLVSAGRSDAANPAVLASGVLPLTFQLREGTPRPAIVVTHTQSGQTWTA